MPQIFLVQRGVRRGCLLSPYLFIICIELLSHEKDNHAQIKGQKIAEQEIKRTVFADDASVTTNGQTYILK